MRRLWHSSNILILLSIAIGLLFIYREVIFDGKILFPSNFLAQFYSPWVTQKFSGWENGIPHKPIGDDQIRIFYPSRELTNTMFKKKSIPLWNPYIFSGTPHIADFQSAVFYPLNILYFFLPQIYAWEILLFIQPIMAAFFMYLFLRFFKLERGALWLGAISFGFSGFMIVWSQENVVVGQAALWLPLCLFGIEGYIRTKKRWYYLVCVLSHAFCFLAGFFQVTFYIFVFSFFYGIFRAKILEREFKKNTLFVLISVYLFALFLSGAQLFPSIEGFFESPRNTTSAWYLFERYLLPFTHLFNIMVPDIFGNPGAYNFFGRGFYRETILYAGLIPFVFAVYISFKAKSNHIVRFFITAAILSFLLTVDSFITRWLFQLPLPFLPTFLPSRILIIATFSIATLSAFGFSKWIRQKDKNELRFMTYLFSIFYIALLLIAAYATVMLLNYDNISHFKRLNDYIIIHGSLPTKINILVLLKNLILPFTMLSLLSAMLLTKKMLNLSILGIVVLTMFGQFYLLNKYLAIGEPEFLYPENAVLSFLQSKNSLDRFISLRQPMQENISTYTRVYSAEGVNPIFSRRYAELLYAVKNNGKITSDIPRVEARLSELGDKENPFEDNRRLRLLSLLGIKYVLYFDDHNPKNSNANEFSPNLFKPVWRHGNWYGLEYADAFPRVFLANNIIVQNNPQKILDVIFDPKTDLLNTVLLEENPVEIKNSKLDKPSISSVSIKSYEPQKVEIKTKTDKPQMLFLSDNYYPGWKAYIDNGETKIYRANYTFRSIYLPEGSHKVTFKYEPMSFKIGFGISVVSVAAILVIIVIRKNKMRII